MKTLAIVMFIAGLAACGHKTQAPPPTPTAETPAATTVTTATTATTATSSIQPTADAIPDASEPDPVPNDGPVPPM